jgi:hypothetical protein
MPTTPTIGPIQQLSVTSSQVSLTVPAAAGGTPPWAYQWYRDVIPVIPSSANIIVGQTGQSILDLNVTENTAYHYAVVATDSTSPTSLTVQTVDFGVVTAAASQMNPQFTNPSVAQFMAYFFRDFPFQPTTQPVDFDNYIQIQDVLNAMFETNGQLNQDLFAKPSTYTQGYFYMTAHFMAENLVNSSQGQAGQYNFLQASKGGAGVSESFAIPQKILDNPTFSMFTKTTYGKKYLALVIPFLTGVMFTVRGHTKP